MSEFEQVRDDLQKLFTLLVDGEPTPDEESESKDKILQYLKVIQQSPEGDAVKDLVQQAMTLASGWDVYDLWFKEVKELPGIVGRILSVLKPSTAPAPPPIKERAPERGVPEPTKKEPQAVPTESAKQVTPGVNLDEIIAKVADQFKSQIQELQGKLTTLEKTLDEKEGELEKNKTLSGKPEPSPGIKPKLQAPKLKLPPTSPQKPPHIPTTSSAGAIPTAPAFRSDVKSAVKMTDIKPIAIKPMVISPGVVEEPLLEPIIPAPVVVQPSISKPVPVQRQIPKPTAIRPIAEPAPVEEMEDLQPIPVQKTAAPKPISIKPISVQPGVIKPISLKDLNAKHNAIKPIAVKPLATPDEAPSIVPFPPFVSRPETEPLGKETLITPKHVPIQITPVSAAPEASKMQPISSQPMVIKPISVQPVSGPMKPMTVTAIGPVQIKPISTQPIAIKPISTNPTQSPGSNLASTLSSIGRPAAPQPEAQISARPITATSPVVSQAGGDLNGALPESKADLYSELIALEGRRFATERRKKELDEQREKGQIAQAEYQNAVSKADADLQSIANRINSIRQKISTL